ncbi:hypothetical protein ACOME3_002942 [Neoechinorhynchus agilis]
MPLFPNKWHRRLHHRRTDYESSCPPQEHRVSQSSHSGEASFLFFETADINSIPFMDELTDTSMNDEATKASDQNTETASISSPQHFCRFPQITADLDSHVAGLTLESHENSLSGIIIEEGSEIIDEDGTVSVATSFGKYASPITLDYDDQTTPSYRVPVAQHSSLPRPSLGIIGSPIRRSIRCKVINGYLFGPLLGEGSYSRVKHCLHLQSLSHRSVKIMKLRRLKHAANTCAVARQELEIMLMLKRNAERKWGPGKNHPNIIQLYDFLNDEHKRQKLYLFLDLAVCSLQDIIDHNPNKPMPAWQLQGYFRQLIDGIEYLHSEHIVHNDIKPGNLLLTRDETLKICDFGSAEMLEVFSRRPLTMRCRATPAYQAPEVSGENSGPYDGFKLDVWSAGVCLYVLSTTKLPFNADNIYVLFQTIEKGDFNIPDWAESSLTALIKGMMTKDWRCTARDNTFRNTKPFKVQWYCPNRFSTAQVRHSEWFRKKHPFTLVDRITPPLELTDTSLEVMKQDLENLHGHRMPRTRSEGGTITINQSYPYAQPATIGAVPSHGRHSQDKYRRYPESRKFGNHNSGVHHKKRHADDNGGSSNTAACHVN